MYLSESYSYFVSGVLEHEYQHSQVSSRVAAAQCRFQQRESSRSATSSAVPISGVTRSCCFFAPRLGSAAAPVAPPPRRSPPHDAPGGAIGRHRHSRRPALVAFARALARRRRSSPRVPREGARPLSERTGSCRACCPRTTDWTRVAHCTRVAGANGAVEWPATGAAIVAAHRFRHAARLGLGRARAARPVLRGGRRPSCVAYGVGLLYVPKPDFTVNQAEEGEEGPNENARP